MTADDIKQQLFASDADTEDLNTTWRALEPELRAIDAEYEHDLSQYESRINTDFEELLAEDMKMYGRLDKLVA